ncbi:hypothetical protein [Arthrobacter sp. CJ23]|uniref:hypothetical protein n=1 Tax=Arthrobacter sp. CJ23 TaxID=2972479 RepID=UPI00215B945E|nr:hypothetical protein [Arthrobacter sp. CJ23]UVJ39272.1 hypothetical protein NVV90_19050 [Arthrobacter sp. CJ23]
MSTQSTLPTAAGSVPAAPSAPAAAPAPAQAPAPSVHVRALITWLAIFPLVAIGMTALGPLTESWHPVLRALVLTLLVVPLAVYFVVPRLFAGYGRLRKSRAMKAARAKA